MKDVQRTSEYQERIVVFGMTYNINIDDLVAIDVTIPRVDSECSHIINTYESMNSIIPNCQLLSFISQLYIWSLNLIYQIYLMGVNDRVLTMTYESLTTRSPKHHILDMTYSL